MILGVVTGAVLAPVRLKGLGDANFVQVTTEDGLTLVAADTLGAEHGSRVILCQGTAAQAALGGRCPVDMVVAGIVKPRS